MKKFTCLTLQIIRSFLILILATSMFSPLAAETLQDQSVRAQFVRHRPARHSPEWEHYRAMEKYYDDLEDHYRWRDRRLSNYYERFEGYFEDMRKGRASVYPNVEPHHIFPHGEPHQSGMPMVVPGQRAAMSRMVPDRTAAMPQVRPIEAPSNSVLKLQSPLPPSTSLQIEPQSELERSYRELQTQLSGLTTGVRWREYLKLPVGKQATLSDREQLEKAAEHYDRISANPDYQAVTQLSAFEATRKQLHEQIYALELGPTLAQPELAGPTLADPEPIIMEELPVPEASLLSE